MKILSMASGVLSVNTYFLVGEDNKTILIDGGENFLAVKSFAKKNNLKITHELLTHSHFDHSGNAKEFQDENVKILISKIDGEKLKNCDTLAKKLGGKSLPCVADYLLTDGEKLTINGIEILVKFTPGHSDGSVCFIVQDNIFSGDTLFYDSYGRYDFPTGSLSDLINSIKMLFNLKGNYNVYPGHGKKTDLDSERKNNPINEYLC